MIKSTSWIQTYPGQLPIKCKLLNFIFFFLLLNFKQNQWLCCYVPTKLTVWSLLVCLRGSFVNDAPCFSSPVAFFWLGNKHLKCINSACFYFVNVVPKSFAIVFIVAMLIVITLRTFFCRNHCIWGPFSTLCVQILIRYSGSSIKMMSKESRFVPVCN